TLLHDVNLHFSRRMAISSGGSISEAEATGFEWSGSGGHHCPPNWTKAAAWSAEQKFCISPSSADFLGLVANATAVADYVTAQDICNRMRANLLMRLSPSSSQGSGSAETAQLQRPGVDRPDEQQFSCSRKNLYWLDNSQEQPQQDPRLPDLPFGLHWSAGLPVSRCELFACLLRPTPSAYLLLDRPNEAALLCLLSAHRRH
uniref:POPLD domain-containing protein n=1 Tax=Macrostomum lignano TaxID=282301 RepID=A0A1I8FND3_9PLAT